MRKKRVLGVLAGQSLHYQSLRDLAEGADAIFAADSGQDVCVANGFLPHVVVGDLDSVGERLAGVEYRERVDQNFSDCDKLLVEIGQLGASDLVVGGFEGDRFDHVFSSLMSLVRSGLDVRVLLGQGFGEVVRHGRTGVVRAGDFSVLPLGSAVVSSQGATWEMDEMRLDFDRGGSLSNSSRTGGSIFVHEGCVLLVNGGAELTWEEK